MHCKSYSHFFSKKFQHICVSLDVNFNESLTNDIVSFEQLGPVVFYVQVNVLIVELKSEALKERHWKQLTRRLNVKWVLSELTLGHVWDIDLQKNEHIVKDIILVAQGEMALEEFLKQVRKNKPIYA